MSMGKNIVNNEHGSMSIEEILSTYISDINGNYHPSDVKAAMKQYAKQEVLSGLESLYSLGCHSEYLMDAIKERIDEIKNPRPI